MRVGEKLSEGLLWLYAGVGNKFVGVRKVNRQAWYGCRLLSGQLEELDQTRFLHPYAVGRSKCYLQLFPGSEGRSLELQMKV